MTKTKIWSKKLRWGPWRAITTTTIRHKKSSKFDFAMDCLNSLLLYKIHLTNLRFTELLISHDINSIFSCSYPVFGEKEESNVSFSPLSNWGKGRREIAHKKLGSVTLNRLHKYSTHEATVQIRTELQLCDYTLLQIATQITFLLDVGPHTWSSRVISVPRVLSVFHFSVKVSPCSAHLYLVSREPETLLVSVLAEPELVNSCRWSF